jgi:AcrR family transcriptional regulator
MVAVHPSPRSRFAKRREATRERLVAAALELFALHGYEGTTMGMVASAADVARATVFNHFPRKDALLLAALADRRRVIADRLQRTVQLPTHARLRDAVRAWARAYQINPEPGAALVRAWAQAGGPFLPDSSDTAGLFTEAIRTGQHRGEVRAAVDPLTAALVLLDASIGTLTRWAATAPGVRRPALERLMIATCDTVVLGLAASPARP